MSSEQTATIVVAAVISYEGRVLLNTRGQSRREPSTSGRLECPGGVVHFGEDPVTALKREVKEEMGVEIRVGRLLHAQVNTYDSGVDYLVMFYACTLLGDEIRAPVRFLLVRPRDVAGCNPLPGTVEAVSRLSELTAQRDAFSFVQNDVCNQTIDETLHVLTYALGKVIEYYHKAKRYGATTYYNDENQIKEMSDLISMCRMYCEQKGWNYEGLMKLGEEGYVARMEDLRKHARH